jgi:hypothetical protein
MDNVFLMEVLETRDEASHEESCAKIVVSQEVTDSLTYELPLHQNVDFGRCDSADLRPTNNPSLDRDSHGLRTHNTC